MVLQPDLRFHKPPFHEFPFCRWREPVVWGEVRGGETEGAGGGGRRALTDSLDPTSHTHSLTLISQNRAHRRLVPSEGYVGTTSVKLERPRPSCFQEKAKLPMA